MAPEFEWTKKCGPWIDEFMWIRFCQFFDNKVAVVHVSFENHVLTHVFFESSRCLTFCLNVSSKDFLSRNKRLPLPGEMIFE